MSQIRFLPRRESVISLGIRVGVAIPDGVVWRKPVKALARKILIQWSRPITIVLILVAALGYYWGSSIQLKLSLTDLLPENHPAVIKLNKLTEVVGGIGYLTIVLQAQDGKSHLAVAPEIVRKMKENRDVRSAFYHREQRFFVDRLLYYVDLSQLKELDSNIAKQIQSSRRKVFDLGLWDENEEKKQEEAKPVFGDDLKELAKKSASISPYLVSKDGKHLLVMVKPEFDSMDLKKSEDLIAYTESVLKSTLPPSVTYDLGERYYNKVVETKMIQSDIVFLGLLSVSLIAGILFFYLKSFRGMLLIFIPVMVGMGLTVGLAKLAIGHINIITGFLMGIVSGLGVDYGIHLLLRLRLEKKEPSSQDPDPVWRTLVSSGHSVFVGAVAAAFAFYLLCFSSFRAFSEFGFICGTGICAVLVCHLVCFSALAKWMRLEASSQETTQKPSRFTLPVLPLPKGLVTGALVSAILIVVGTQVGFEYDFDKLMKHSEKLEAVGQLIDVIYDRSSAPSAFSASTKEEALQVEKVFKDKYMPKLVSELISGASIVPEDQIEKQKVLQNIHRQISGLKDRWLTGALDVPAQTIRDWVQAKPFTFTDIPPHVQDSLRGTKNAGYLMYFYPAIKLNDANRVHRYADMIRDIEKQFPELLTGSDAVVFSDILQLIARDGAAILLVIFISVGLFIWINVRKWSDTLLSYLPLIIALPVGMGIMVIFGVKFNIFNIAIIPTFVAMGIDVPIHLVHRTREIGSGYKAARDLAASINLALITAGIGFGVLVFARAGVLRSLGWISLLATLAIWWVGLFLLPAYLERFHRGEGHVTNDEETADRQQEPLTT